MTNKTERAITEVREAPTDDRFKQMSTAWLVQEIARNTVRAMRPQHRADDYDDNEYDWAMAGMRAACNELDARLAALKGEAA